MPAIIYHVAVTLDGFICRPDGAFDCFPQSGPHVDDYLHELSAYGVVLMGRKTYEVGLAFGVTNPYPHLESHVFSRTLAESPDPAVTLVREGAIEHVRALARRDGKPIYLCGGAELASALFQHELIDEVCLKVNPVLIGQGRPLIAGLPRDVALSLVSTKVYANGVIVTRHSVSR
ncbi:MAG TPA: dihydrofolate reductase family protein [Myxococcota bacterium]|nr:dihydrofolate reductase family protein [Myxococcota bacterium]